MSMRTKLAVAIALVALIIPATRGAAEPGVTLQLVATNLNQPIHVTHAGDESGRLFIVERAGIVKILQNGSLLTDPFINITSRIRSTGLEQGLLSIAFHPDYETNGEVILSYSDLDGNTVVARYLVSPSNPNELDPASEEVLFTQVQPFANHNGGLALFGPDGYLYFGLGDGGGAYDPTFNGQNTQTLLGTLLRLDIDSSASGYTIPADNPFVGDPTARPEIWAYGLRNPWRFTFDSETDDLYIADVGQGRWEEVDFQPASSVGGENYGWNRYEGNEPPLLIDLPVIPPKTPYVFPVHAYFHSQGECSVTGGPVYRGEVIPGLNGAYIFGDYCSGRIWALRNTGETWTNSLLISSSLRISSFGQDEDGEMYIANLGLTDGPGRIHKIVPSGG